jgi:hypothetical protein
MLPHDCKPLQDSPHPQDYNTSSEHHQKANRTQGDSISRPPLHAPRKLHAYIPNILQQGPKPLGFPTTDTIHARAHFFSTSDDPLEHQQLHDCLAAGDSGRRSADTRPGCTLANKPGLTRRPGRRHTGAPHTARCTGQRPGCRLA